MTIPNSEAWLQYVAPRNFQRLRAPLLAASAAAR